VDGRTFETGFIRLTILPVHKI